MPGYGGSDDAGEAGSYVGAGTREIFFGQEELGNLPRSALCESEGVSSTQCFECVAVG